MEVLWYLINPPVIAAKGAKATMTLDMKKAASYEGPLWERVSSVIDHVNMGSGDFFPTALRDPHPVPAKIASEYGRLEHGSEEAFAPLLG